MPYDEVHVWRVSLDQPRARVQGLFDTLSPEEKERASRFHFQRDCNHFIVARGILRQTLGIYMSVEPHRLRLGYYPYGKPYLTDMNGSDLRFNLSHSHGLALLALSRGRELGINIEYMRPEVAEEQIAERFFSRREVASLKALSALQQAEAFFNCWTRKEAYIKAKGEGLSMPLDMFDVSLAPGEPAALLETRPDPGERARWAMMDLAPGGNFKAALVVEKQGWRLRCFQWAG